MSTSEEKIMTGDLAEALDQLDSLTEKVTALEHQQELWNRQLAVIQKHLERAAQELLRASKVEKKEQRRRLP